MLRVGCHVVEWLDSRYGGEGPTSSGRTNLRPSLIRGCGWSVNTWGSTMWPECIQLTVPFIFLILLCPSCLYFYMVHRFCPLWKYIYIYVYSSFRPTNFRLRLNCFLECFGHFGRDRVMAANLFLKWPTCPSFNRWPKSFVLILTDTVHAFPSLLHYNIVFIYLFIYSHSPIINPLKVSIFILNTFSST